MIKNLKSLFSPEQITAIFSGSNLNKNKKTESQYGNMLRESRKIRLLYGNLSKKYLQKLFKSSHFFPCQTDETIFTILESRLDVVLYRSGFFKSIATARQLVLTGGIEVNKRKVISPASKMVPGDIICILKKSKEKIKQSKTLTGNFDFDSNNLKYVTPLVSTLTSSLKKKEIGWRFKASPFLLALLVNQRKSKQNQDIKNNVFKTKWIESTFFKCKTILVSKPYFSLYFPQKKPTVLSEVLHVNDSVLPTHPPKVSPKVSRALATPQLKIGYAKPLPKQNESFFLQPINENTTSFCAPNKDQRKSLLEPNNSGDAKQKLNFLNNWFFSSYLIFLRKQFILSAKKLFLAKQKKNIFDNKTVSAKQKMLKSQQKKIACFLKQRNLLDGQSDVRTQFFKEQYFFESKKAKPLHLESSYKSLSIVFLFPPQRVCFPTFINISQIYK